MKLDAAQEAAVTHIYETGRAYLVGQMGSGKTITALTAAQELLDAGEVTRVLVVAPLKVCKDVWPREGEKWPHIHDEVAVACGPLKTRLYALKSNAKLVVVNFENLAWLLGSGFDFDMLIIDEVTKLKAGGVAFKALRKALDRFTVRVSLTGTPVSESFEQLFYCAMAVDGGAAFGRNKSHFMSRFFYQLSEYEWSLRPGAEVEIVVALGDMLIVLPDYVHTLPPSDEQVVKFPLGDEALGVYKQLVRDSLLGDEVTADNAAVLTGKLAQAASGFVYTDDGDTMFIHDAKIPVIASLLPDGESVVIVYQYREELIRLRKWFPGLLVLADGDDRLDQFRREGGLLALHPKSAGHGLDLTTARTMIFVGPVWSSDLMRQTIARIWRRGQTLPCFVSVLAGIGTIEVEMIRREHEKQGHHALLMSLLD